MHQWWLQNKLFNKSPSKLSRCVQEGRDPLIQQEREAQTSRKNTDVSRDINEYLRGKTEWMLFHTVFFLMFNADPDASALKWDETCCYMAELIRWQVHMHVYIHALSLTHSNSSNRVQRLRQAVMLLYNLLWDGGGSRRNKTTWMDSDLEKKSDLENVSCFVCANLKCITYEQ